MKHEWRKKEKNIYLPKTKPELIEVPEYNYIVISGEGNPNGEHFSDCITALYSLAYAIKMNMKKLDNTPKNYTDWAVYPLEGVWDLKEGASISKDRKFNKDDLVFDIMIRQPEFVSDKYFSEILELTKKKKPHPLLEKIRFEKIKDGKCIQAMHLGSYDDEKETFEKMEEFMEDLSLKRREKSHREIYLSDFRKIEISKLKTVLRFQVED